MSTKSRKFLIQFELSPETRWLFHPGEEAYILRIVAEQVATAHTAGPRPRVTVTLEEAGQEGLTAELTKNSENEQ